MTSNHKDPSTMTTHKDTLLELATRWFAEIFHPARKCNRVGHAMQNVGQLVYLYPSKSYRGVADEALETTPTCKRCGYTGATTITIERSLTGLSMSSERWRNLRRDKRLAQ